MFDFEKLEIYQIIKVNNQRVLNFISQDNIPDKLLSDKLKKASLNIQLRLAEGTGKFVTSEKRNLICQARTSVFKCVALLDILKGLGYISSEFYNELYSSFEQISKMLLGMYRNIKEENKGGESNLLAPSR